MLSLFVKINMYAILLNHIQNREDKFSTAIPICPYHQQAGIFFTKTLNNTIKTDPVTQSLLSGHTEVPFVITVCLCYSISSCLGCYCQIHLITKVFVGFYCRWKL